MDVLEQSYTTGAPRAAPSGQVALREPDATSTDGGAEDTFSIFGNDGFDFFDVLDVVNPLQHLPIVSTMYREATGDALAAAPRVVGATLFFGPLGLVSSLANVLIEEQTGQDLGAHVADWVLPDDGTQDGVPSDTALASQVPTDSDNTAFSLDGAVDPVSDWARREVAWANANTTANTPPPLGTDNIAVPLPDATPFLTDPGDLAGLSASHMPNALRAATWAYEAAAGLERAG